jgi:hypothetical protein
MDPGDIAVLLQSGLQHEYDGGYVPLKVLQAKIDYLLQQPDVAFIHIPMSLAWIIDREIAGAHQNALFIDVKRGIIECFEPAGYNEVHEAVLFAVARLFPHLQVQSPASQCPRSIGPQKKAGDSSWCVTYSALYVLYRILNPSLSPKDIANYLSRGTPEDIKSKMRRVQGFVQNHMSQLNVDKYTRKNYGKVIAKFRKQGHSIPASLLPFTIAKSRFAPKRSFPL